MLLLKLLFKNLSAQISDVYLLSFVDCSCKSSREVHGKIVFSDDGHFSTGRILNSLSNNLNSKTLTYQD